MSCSPSFRRPESISPAEILTADLAFSNYAEEIEEEYEIFGAPAEIEEAELYPIRPKGCVVQSEVRFATSKSSNKKVAIKMMAATEFNRYQSMLEADMELRHTNIAKMLDIQVRDDHLWLVHEFASGMDLFDWCEEHHNNETNPVPPAETEEKTREIMRQIVSAVRYCHKQEIAHRDIKMENIRTEPRTLHTTLIDFGLTTYETGPHSQKKTGSIPYAAPELLLNSPGILSPMACDIWSLAVILFTILHGLFPYIVEEYPGGLYLMGKPSRPSTAFSAEFRALVRLMFADDPAFRPNIQQVADHAWLKTRSPDEA